MLVELHESASRTIYVFPVWALENVLELTRKVLQRSRLVLSHLTQPGAGASVESNGPLLHFEGDKIFLTFLVLR